MNLKKAGMVLLLAGSLAAVTGCSSEKEDKQEDTKKEIEKKEYYDGELSEEEMNATHLSLELMENVTVDADITSLDNYEKGLDSYFLQMPDGKKLAPDKQKIKGKGDIPKEYKSVKKVITANVAETLNEKEEMSDFKKKEWLTITAPFDNSEKIFSYTLNLDKDNKPCGKSISLSRGRQPKEGEEVNHYISDFDVAWHFMLKDMDFDTSDLSFSSRKEVAGKAKEQVERLLGKKMSDTYDSAVVNEKTYDTIVQNGFFEGEQIKSDADFYAYFFYDDINGFPWKYSSLQRILEEGEKFAGDVDADGDYAFPLNQGEQRISYGEDGIRELSLSDTAEVSKVYRKNEIMQMDELLIKIGDYYADNRSDTLMSNTIYEIKLCYLSAFSNKEDGKIRNIVKPYWEVKIWQEHSDGLQSVRLHFDVETGEYGEYS